MKKYGECVTCGEQDKAQFFKAFDRSGTGLLSFEDVCEGHKRKAKYMCKLMEIMKAWTMMLTKSFHMSEEACKKMKAMKCPEGFAEKIFDCHDEDKNGYLSLCEFMKL